MLWDNQMVPASQVKKSKREIKTGCRLTDTILFFGDLFTSNFFKEAWHFTSWLCFCFQAKKYLTWLTPQTELLSITGQHRNSNLLWYIPENRSSPRVLLGKWLLKNYKLTTRLKNKTCTNPQIKNRKNSRELRLIRPQTRDKIPKHMYSNS
jgi:hypothetical protein